MIAECKGILLVDATLSDFCILYVHQGTNTLHRKCNGFLPNRSLHHQSAECQMVTNIISVRLVITGLIFRNAEIHSEFSYIRENTGQCGRSLS